MELLDLTYILRDEMFNREQNLTVIEKDKCFVLAALISYKIINCEETYGFRPDSTELLNELHLLNHSDELFSGLPFGDADIAEIIDYCYRHF